MTGFPTTTSGTPVTLTDSIGTKYGIYSDPQGNKYVTYNDPVGTYYLNTNNSKVYLPNSQTSGTGIGSQPYIFIDSTGGNKYLLNRNADRIYLTLSSTSGNN